MNKAIALLLVLSAAALLADEIPPYSDEFDALAEKPGCTGFPALCSREKIWMDFWKFLRRNTASKPQKPDRGYKA